MVADIDAMVIGLALLPNPAATISNALALRYSSVGACLAKNQEFVTARFGDAATLRSACISVIDQNFDVPFATFRGAVGAACPKCSFSGWVVLLHNDLVSGVSTAMADVVINKYASS